MGQKVDLQNGKHLFSRRVKFDLPKKISEIHELRERVRLAEMAVKKQIRSERSADTRTNK